MTRTRRRRSQDTCDVSGNFTLGSGPGNSKGREGKPNKGGVFRFEGCEKSVLRRKVAQYIPEDLKMDVKKGKSKPGEEKEEEVSNTDEGSMEKEKVKVGTLERITRGRGRIVNSFRQFFAEEWEAFKNEKETFLHEKDVFRTNLDFDAIIDEWKYRPSNEAHWENQKKKVSESDTFPPLFYSIVIGFIFTVVPNGAIVLDINGANQYIFGTWYVYKNGGTLEDVTTQNKTCRIRNDTGKVECFEKDPIWGTLMLVLMGLPGIFYILYFIFIQGA